MYKSYVAKYGGYINLSQLIENLVPIPSCFEPRSQATYIDQAKDFTWLF